MCVCVCSVSGFCPVIKLVCTLGYRVYRCVYSSACEWLCTCAFIRHCEHSQLVPLSVFLGNLVLQVGFEGRIADIFVCVDIKEKIGRD